VYHAPALTQCVAHLACQFSLILPPPVPTLNRFLLPVHILAAEVKTMEMEDSGTKTLRCEP
jgi:hypothetical protein